MTIWDERYNRDEFVYGVNPNPFVQEHAESIPKGKVLCLAEGEGRNAVYLAQLGYDVVAVDSSKIGLEKAQNLAAQKNVSIQTIVADLADFIIPEQTFHGIISIYCHIPPSLRIKVHAACVQGLCQDGLFLLEAYTPEQLEYKTGGPPVADLMMTPASIAQEFAGLNTRLLQERIVERVEGLAHTGKSAIVQYIGEK